ncbi:MAG TPA: hydroxymethylbilane synthase [Vicinamibacteria bacterium]|nr:hydroxymethylbilane synthase [Vicinamibacteria bacterium]
MRPIRIGSRGSRLAILQTRAIEEALRERDPSARIEVEVIETRGDRITDRAIAELGGSGLFIKEIERALLDDRIDLAIHSMKDVPSAVPEGLVLAATTKRIDPCDALVSRRALDLDSIPQGATIGTGSPRRSSQLLAHRPDLRIVDLRGNVPTRLEKFDRSSWEGVVLAAAGLVRLGLMARIRSRLPVDLMVPAVGQGALAIQARTDDRAILERVEFLNDDETERAVAAERAFLGRVQGGCQLPMGAHAVLDGDVIFLRAYVGTVDGARCLRRQARGPAQRPGDVGASLAETMLDAGAAEIVSELGKQR